jgi:hypothetical protein
MQRPGRVRLLTLITVLAMAGACGTTSTGNNIIKTAYGVDSAAPFVNVLVISVAGDIPNRVLFERQLATAISGEETPATAYYTVVGRNPQLARDILENAVKAREFDAIILTRLKGQDRADLVANRPTGRLFDLYLYDYEELNIPASIPLGSTVAFVVEVYDTVLRKKVWAIESLTFDAVNVESVVTQQAAAIAAEILKDGIVQQ